MGYRSNRITDDHITETIAGGMPQLPQGYSWEIVFKFGGPHAFDSAHVYLLKQGLVHTKEIKGDCAITGIIEDDEPADFIAYEIVKTANEIKGRWVNTPEDNQAMKDKADEIKRLLMVDNPQVSVKIEIKS